ncbi:XdhC family protein [Acetobacter conturbans]|uniref:Xanthine dehydrogenase n=1 Tax=Acetobacter conturbans TaxID=1737472 RepID=A0ABX0K5C1_9PROT|nr:XdhC/CoxI family protein [Acetobacter conturbans]NHN88614.1 xanthine dehydrogenase [Acetobacter conturbans]
MSCVSSPSTALCPFTIARDWLSDGDAVAFATVVGTGGRSPRPLGSIMVMGRTGRVEGSVSGGCVEADVMSAASEIMAGGPPRLLSYGGDEIGLWSVGLACGGRIDVFVEAVRSSQSGAGTFPARFLSRIGASRSAGERIVLGYALDGSSHALVSAKTPFLSEGKVVPAAIRAVMTEQYVKEKDGAASPGVTPGWFVQTLLPPPRLLIVGAVHIAQALAGMAGRVGYDVTIIDPRGSLATPERFPGVRLVQEWPDEVLADMRPDRNTAIVTLTHDSKLDDPALMEALGSPAFYVGALGSRKTHASRLERLREAGVEEAALRRIRGPVGLPIGSLDVEEIAVSIMAEIVAVRRGSPLADEVAWWSPRQDEP